MTVGNATGNTFGDLVSRQQIEHQLVVVVSHPLLVRLFAGGHR